MSFKAAKCPNCAGDIQVPDDKYSAKCMYCGSDIVVREAIQAAAGGVNIKNLLMLAKDAEKSGNNEEAYQFYSTILEHDSKLIEAILGRAINSLFFSSGPNTFANFKDIINKLISGELEGVDLKIAIKNKLYDVISAIYPEKALLELVDAKNTNPIFILVHEMLDSEDVYGLLAKGSCELLKGFKDAVPYFEKAFNTSNRNKILGEKIVFLGFGQIGRYLNSYGNEPEAFYVKTRLWFDLLKEIDSEIGAIDGFCIQNMPKHFDNRAVFYKVLDDIRGKNVVNPKQAEQTKKGILDLLFGN